MVIKEKKVKPGSEPGTQSGLTLQLPTPDTTRCIWLILGPFLGRALVSERKWRKDIGTGAYHQRSTSPSPQLCPRSGQSVATPKRSKTQRLRGPRRPIKKSEGRAEAGAPNYRADCCYTWVCVLHVIRGLACDTCDRDKR